MKAAFHTLGCKTNSYETQAMTEQFEGAGFEIVPFSRSADVYIINTCSVTAVAAQKSRQMLHRCKKMSPDALVVACGCYVQEAAEKLMADGAVDLVIGNNEKSKVLEMVRKALKEGGIQESDGKQIKKVDDLTHCRVFESQNITNAGSHVRACVKIQDGCDRFCSYCIIPFLRGRSRSRDQAKILQEVRNLAEAGVKEVVLTGIDISDYRGDPCNNTVSSENEYLSTECRESFSSGDALAQLILSIEEIQSIERIRLGSLEAGIITGGFLEQIKESRKLCPHFHLSLQSGSNTVLKRMNRHYTTEEFLQSLSLIRKVFPDPAITTDVIAGFPGETEEEFEETLQFIQNAGFSQLHVFPYSRRKGTRADRMPAQLSREQKAERARRLILAGEELQESYMKNFLGREVRLLIEEKITQSGEEYYVGFTPEYVRGALPASGIFNHDKIINKIVTIYPREIRKSGKEFFLLGE